MLSTSSCTCLHRSGSGHRLVGEALTPKKPCVEAQSSRQAPHEHVVPSKKRKSPHERRSKRAASPGAFQDVDWDMLEQEENELPLRQEKGPASPFDEFENTISDDEYEYDEGGVHAIRLSN